MMMKQVHAAVFVAAFMIAPVPAWCESPSGVTPPNENTFELCDQLHETPAAMNLCKDAVRIEVFQSLDAPIGRGYQGSGTLVSDRGDILTAYHVVAVPGTVKVDVQFANGQHRLARLVAKEEKTGLAVLRIEDGSVLPQPYYPLNFPQREFQDINEKRTVNFSYFDHAVSPAIIVGWAGVPGPFSLISEPVLRRTNIDPSLMAEYIKMNAGAGTSGSAVALRDSGEIVGVVQFGRGAFPRATVSFLTSAVDTALFLKSLGLS
jgi:hypothetical protein